MKRHELIEWIRGEITATRVIQSREIVGYEETLEPNPEMYYSEFTSFPTTRDRQHIIVQKPVYGGLVDRKVLDEKRAADAAEALVSLILDDEQYIYLAEELMSNNNLFFRHWERLYLNAGNEKTKRIAARHIGRTPYQLFVKRIIKIVSVLKPYLEFVWRVVVTVCVFSGIIYYFWPKSKLGLWIARIAKNIVFELKKIFG